MNLFCNGRIYPTSAPLIEAANRSFRYGEGLFETIKVRSGRPLLWSYHWERLQMGMSRLQISADALSEQALLNQLEQLCATNGCADAARARIAVYRTDDNSAGYVLEAGPLEAAAFSFNSRGWHLGLYEQGRKAVDVFSNIKSANYLLYAMAGRYAHQKGFDESLVCNTSGNICDGSRTNIFLLMKNELITPALDQGCVAGVMRRHLLQVCDRLKIACREATVLPEMLLEAEEIFLTNAIQGIRWVERYRDRQFGNDFAARLYRLALATI